MHGLLGFSFYIFLGGKILETYFWEIRCLLLFEEGNF